MNTIAYKSGVFDAVIKLPSHIKLSKRKAQEILRRSDPSAKVVSVEFAPAVFN